MLLLGFLKENIHIQIYSMKSHIFSKHLNANQIHTNPKIKTHICPLLIYFSQMSARNKKNGIACFSWRKGKTIKEILRKYKTIMKTL